MQRLPALLALALVFTLLMGGCVQVGSPDISLRNGTNASIPLGSAPNASPSNAPNSTSPSSSAPSNATSSVSQNLSEQLLAANALFLNQTQAASQAASELNFSTAADLFNRSGQSAIALTQLLAQVCQIRAVNCTAQLDGYAQIALCARERSLFYDQMDAIMPRVQAELNCTASADLANTSLSLPCQAHEAAYLAACHSLLNQSERTYTICQAVMPDINVRQSAQMICPGLSNLSEPASNGSVSNLSTGASVSESGVRSNSTASSNVVVHFFYLPTCGFCHRQQTEANPLLQAEFPQVVWQSHDISDPANRALWESMMRARNQTPKSVPCTLIGPDALVGYYADQTPVLIRSAIRTQLGLLNASA